MKVTTKLKARDSVRMPVTFTNSGNIMVNDELDMYIGENFGIVIFTHKNMKLSDDNKKRINILTTNHE